MRLSPLLALGLPVAATLFAGVLANTLPKRDMDMALATDTDSATEADSIPASLSLVPVPHRPSAHHSMPILRTHLAPEERLYWEQYSTETYFNTKLAHRPALYLHLAGYVGSFVLLYPLVLVFSNTGHRLYLPALMLHTGLVVFSAINFGIFQSSIKELYPHNAFTPMTSLLLVASLAHCVVAAIAVAYRFLNIDNEFDYSQLDHDEESSSLHSPDHTLHSPALTLHESPSNPEAFELHALTEDAHLKTSNSSMLAAAKPSRLSQFMLKFPAFKNVTQKFGRTALRLTAVFNWAMLAYFLVYLPTGIATYCVYGTGNTVFNLLAHFIKGGVFFVLGLVTLARYCGAFKIKGWAWNHRLVSQSAVSASRWLRLQPEGLFTMEFVESALILFYGCTNIFMEHMANAGKPYSSKDLQHASIAFIYIGCGACGVFLEKRLASWRYHKALDNFSLMADAKTVASVAKASPGYSPNPFPVVTIFWTGIIMSQHEQDSALSTAIHIQWGNLFVMACGFRLLTYLLCMLVPANLKFLRKPLCPMTELVVAFALLAGGLVFMESCDPVVQSLEYHGYSGMFTLNVALGVTTLLMAWVMAMFTLKDAIVARTRHQN